MRVKVKLQTISPVSWGWYNRKTDPLKVRVTSIRGTLRKWYRWYLASISEPQPEEIRRKEDEVFGTVHGEARRSAVKIQFDSLEGLNNSQMEVLSKWGRKFYMMSFDLLMEGKCEHLIEAAKALSLNVTLGGFGYRSNRGYGSFKISSIEGDSRECEEALNFLELAREVTNSSSKDSWEKNLSELLKSLGVRKLEGQEWNLYKVQNLSNCYILTAKGDDDWEESLSELEEKLKEIERSSRPGGRNKKDYRVLLGFLVPINGKMRRSSPLILGLGNGYIRGVLFISKDYPKDVLDHFNGESGLLEGFDFVKKTIKSKFEVKWVGDLL
ncbi:MAG: type III-B CRISPR module RAMP protein Cmr1 [Candidatus Korarchaeum sp.]|nr:type III-B CRISPR module RAMP protein Cmr1 [Candidatus Korarchaeum sp.]